MPKKCFFLSILFLHFNFISFFVFTPLFFAYSETLQIAEGEEQSNPLNPQQTNIAPLSQNTPSNVTCTEPTSPPTKKKVCAFIDGYCTHRYFNKIQKNFLTITENTKKINDLKNKLDETSLEELTRKLDTDLNPLLNEINGYKDHLLSDNHGLKKYCTLTLPLPLNTPLGNESLETLKTSIIRIINTKIKTYEILSWLCGKSKTNAVSCCQNPSNCLFQNIAGESPGLDIPSIAGVLAGITKSALSTKEQSDAKKMCETMKTINATKGIITASLSSLCFTKIESCVNFCHIKQETQVIPKPWETIHDIAETGEETVRRNLEIKAGVCRELRVSGGATAAKSALETSFSLFFQNCIDTANNPITTTNNTTEAFWENYCQTNPTSELCSKCLNPTTRGSEECQSQSASLLSKNQNNDPLNEDSGSADFTTSNDRPPDPTQTTLNQQYRGRGSSTLSSQSPLLNSGGAGSGGGLGGGGSGSGSPKGGKANSKSGRDKGYNTDILGGTQKRGGFGYNSPTYGSTNYQGSRRNPYSFEKNNLQDKKKFSLKDFLPGKGKDPSKSKKSRKLRNSHQNIFLNHSKRIQNLCLSHIVNCI